MEVRLNIEEQYISSFLEYIKTLSYVKVDEVVVSVAKKESVAEGFRRAAQDQEMLNLAEEGIEDYAKMIGA